MPVFFSRVTLDLHSAYVYKQMKDVSTQQIFFLFFKQVKNRE